MKYTAVISQSAYEYIKTLEYGFDILRLPEDDRLDKPVRSHADMNIFHLGSVAVISRLYAEKYPHIVKHLREVCGLDVRLSDTERKGEYPHDVMLNVLVCGNVAFSLENYTCTEIKKVLNRERIDLINVRQGYAACSTLAFGKYIVTSDKSILRAGSVVGLECLQISTGGIRLSGYNEGFIGGASGVCEDTVYFTGNVKLHPDGEKILRFIERGGFKVVCLSDGELCDVGGIKFIRNVKSQK